MAAAAPYLLAIGGAALKSSADAKQADEQRSQLNAALARTDQAQHKANGLIEEQAATLSPIARAAAMATQTGANIQQAKSDLTAAGATGSDGNAIINTSGDDGAVSKEFLTAKADRALSEGNRLSAIAQQLAQLRTPGQLQEQEGQQRANLTEQLADMWGTTQGLNNGNQQTAAQVQPPAYGQLGELASTVGTAYASKGMGKGLGASRGLTKAAKGGTIWVGGDTNMGGYA
jgi:hypothetical protein